MTAEEFDFLLDRVQHLITKQNTKMRRAIPPRERLSLTLRFLATGLYDFVLNEHSMNVVITFLSVWVTYVSELFGVMQVKRSSPSDSSTGWAPAPSHK